MAEQDRLPEKEYPYATKWPPDTFTIWALPRVSRASKGPFGRRESALGGGNGQLLELVWDAILAATHGDVSTLSLKEAFLARSLPDLRNRLNEVVSELEETLEDRYGEPLYLDDDDWDCDKYIDAFGIRKGLELWIYDIDPKLLGEHAEHDEVFLAAEMELAESAFTVADALEFVRFQHAVTRAALWELFTTGQLRPYSELTPAEIKEINRSREPSGGRAYRAHINALAAYAMLASDATITTFTSLNAALSKYLHVERPSRSMKREIGYKRGGFETFKQRLNEYVSDYARDPRRGEADARRLVQNLGLEWPSSD